MARMTEEEADTLDDLVTNNEITLAPNGSDWLTRRDMRLLGLATASVNYLTTKAAADRKSPVEIIDDLVREKIGVGA